MSDLIDRQALRAAHGLGADCHDCKRDMKSCQYDRDYSLMDFCEWLDDAPTASPWHRVEEELPEIGQIVLVYDEWRRLSICQLDNSYRWLRQGGGWFNGPCACYWMPIEPPKEG